jgi:glycine cleavage system H protein
MGITDFAQGALGDIVYVQMPKVGDLVVADKVCGEVESTKSVSEIFAPVSGTITAVNEALVNTPELVNSQPYGEGWLAEISVTDTPTPLLSAADYGQITS